MKALSTAMLIVVTVVVILIVAVVILTIFGKGILVVTDATTQRANCITECTISCQTFNNLPPTWIAHGCKDPNKIGKEINIVDDCHCCLNQGEKWCAIANGGKGECRLPDQCK